MKEDLPGLQKKRSRAVREMNNSGNQGELKPNPAVKNRAQHAPAGI
jgi:hypothetical protein